MRIALPFALVTLLAAAPATGGVFDDVQVFDGRIAEPGGFDFNQHLVFGRQGRSGDGAPRNGAVAVTEIGYVTAPWHEVAIYIPVAREFSGDVFGGGFKLRNSFVLPGAGNRPIAWGLDVELRHQSYRFSEADWAVNLRPIFDLRNGPWQLILNPTVGVPLGRGGAAFTPAVRGVRQVAENVWLGLEHYMDLGRVNRFETAAQQAHQLFVTTDWQLRDSFAIHVGVGHGLTRASDRWIGKFIVSFEF